MDTCKKVINEEVNTVPCIYEYCLFRSLHHFMKDHRFESFEEVEKTCQEPFRSKPKECYFDQIPNLTDRWQKVLNNDCLYFGLF